MAVETYSAPFLPAQEPKIFGANDFQLTPGISSALVGLGLSRRCARGLAISFEDELEGRSDSGVATLGRIARSGYTEQDEAGNNTYYPLLIGLQSDVPLKKANEVILHEIGHAIKREQRDYARRSYSYRDPTLVKRTKRYGVAGIAGSVASEAAAVAAQAPFFMLAGLSVVTAAGFYVARYPRHMLWQLDREERFCRRFARINRDVELIEQC